MGSALDIMKFGKVMGNVVATQKVESYNGVSLLVMQPLDERLQPAGEPMWLQIQV